MAPQLVSGVAKNAKNSRLHRKKRKKQFVLTFDEKAREDFLTGFRKRKLQRKKKAQEDLEIELKAERKRIKYEAKNAFQKLVVTHRDIPELAALREDADVVDMDTHEVVITELDSARLARENNWIGTNQVQYDNLKSESDDQMEKHDSKEEVEGMELKSKKPKSKPAPEQTNFKTRKDVQKYVKQLATKNVKTSKAFQKKKDVEKVKNKKKKLREERRKGSNRVKSKREKHKKRK